jgi:hypothetical protein
MSEFKELIGKTLAEITGKVGDERMEFKTSNGEAYAMYHDQDCCETVSVEDICGDLGDLIGVPIIEAEASSSETRPEGFEGSPDEQPEWTFYKLGTSKGRVTIRWYGASDYYSTSVDFSQIAP